MKDKAHLTAEFLRAILHYDPLTGVFTRRTNRGPSKAGDVAGSICAGGYLEIGIGNGRREYGHRLAWLYTHGTLPEDGDIAFKSGADRAVPRIADLEHRPSSGALPGAVRVRSKWLGYTYRGGRRVDLGLFPTEIEAHMASIAAKATATTRAASAGRPRASWPLPRS